MRKDVHARTTILHCATISGSLDGSSLEFMLHVVGDELDANDICGKTAAQYATELATDNVNQSMWETNRWNTLNNSLLRSGVNSSSGLYQGTRDVKRCSQNLVMLYYLRNGTVSIDSMSLEVYLVVERYLTGLAMRLLAWRNW